MDYGFIITRYVNSPETNRYWNQSIKLLKIFYPKRKVVIIDDNSKQQYIKADYNYENVIIIQSEYPGRGELLPYIYYLKYKWFPNAVILHDSVFVHRHIPFEYMKHPVLPLWHHPYDKENSMNIFRLTNFLTNNYFIQQKILKNEKLITLGINYNAFDLCFGAQCFINLNFLEQIEKKYKLTNLISAITNRTDRCSFERVIGLIFNEEYFNDNMNNGKKKLKSLFGHIYKFPNAFKYNYLHYKQDLSKRLLPSMFVKVWTGR
jgi:hypothetical protein